MSIRSMNQATTTMNQLQKQLDIIGNNMSNSSTTGYKSRQAEFSSLLFQQINNMNHPENQTGRLTPNGIRTGLGARLGAVNVNNALGSLNQTDRDLDAALLNENHFFEIQGNAGEALLQQNGTFNLQPMNTNMKLDLVRKTEITYSAVMGILFGLPQLELTGYKLKKMVRLWYLEDNKRRILAKVQLFRLIIHVSLK